MCHQGSSTSTIPSSTRIVTSTDHECKDQGNQSWQSSSPSSTGFCMALFTKDPSSGAVERTTLTNLGTLQTGIAYSSAS